MRGPILCVIAVHIATQQFETQIIGRQMRHGERPSDQSARETQLGQRASFCKYVQSLTHALAQVKFGVFDTTVQVDRAGSTTKVS
ncbi:hypothetical protein CFIMG_005840RA [Ceratocystis fimbriata CBS 114723]|uniref:Uncharacterized protein n=1 Tax=Ceratocystis fimbriata CBS 114723 TaxID=1035309 RepID=A0A2C5WKN4_9PEZI|nr:hypothetical protein CFIMG_005840RA [Ceratocystis fimbriata CBS 114723]